MEKIVDRLLLITALFACVFGVCAFLFRGAEHDSASVADELYPLCEYIEIDVLRLSVTVMPYEEDMIRVSYKNDVPLDIEIGDNTLKITESEDFVISLFTGSDADFALYVYLPHEIYRDIAVYTSSGEVKIGGVDSKKVTVSTDTGDILSEGTRSLSALSTAKGDITLDFESVIEGSNIQTRYGNAKLIFPKDSSVALDFETETGECRTSLISGKLYGSNMYSINGGRQLIHASLETGTLDVSEK